MLTLISVSEVENQYIEESKDNAIQNIQNKSVGGISSSENLSIKTTLSNCINELTKAIQQSTTSSLPHFIIVDDLLATGGTLVAAIKLIESLGGIVVGVACVIELEDLKGREVLSGYNVFSLLKY